jgi:hypothetical protein
MESSSARALPWHQAIFRLSRPDGRAMMTRDVKNVGVAFIIDLESGFFIGPGPQTLFGRWSGRSLHGDALRLRCAVHVSRRAS